MSESIVSYFAQDVLANYYEYRDSLSKKETGKRRDKRLAINTAKSLYHIREHLPVNPIPSRADITKKCPNYEILADIVNASKHKRLTRNNPLFKDINNLEERIVVTEYEDALGKYYDAEKELIAHLEDGTSADLNDIILKVLNFWVKEINKFGGNFGIVKPIIKQVPPPRNSDDGAALMAIEVYSGAAVKFSYIFQKYDKDVGKFFRKDLQGEKAKTRIFEADKDIRISLTNKITGKSFDVNIPLTEKQKNDYNKIQNERLKKIYIANVINTSKEAKSRIKQKLQN